MFYLFFPNFSFLFIPINALKLNLRYESDSSSQVEEKVPALVKGLKNCYLYKNI